MGSYTFKWEHPAEEVYVTGTFDNWAKSEKLEKKGSIFDKTVVLADASQAILYKFVVDGEWKHDPTAKLERDHEGNVNNVVYPEHIKRDGTMASHTTSSVAPGATTTALAGAQPLEVEKDTEKSPPPGAFPETPAVASDSKDDEQKHGLSGAAAGAAAGVTGLAAAGAAALGLSSGKKDEKEQTYSVNPIPASAGTGNPVTLAPGEKVPAPSTINNNTVTSTVRDDPSLKTEQTFGVAPLPATGGIGNPIHLQPGAPVPESSTITGNTITSNVKLDKDSYEKGSSGAPQLPPVLTPQSEKEAAGTAAIFGGLGPQTSNMIPESSMAMGKDAPAPLEGAAISSVAGNSTTNELAGAVPKEPRGVPQVVSESQKDAHVGPEAAANPTAVVEKKEVESELKSKVHEAPVTSDDTTASKNESNKGVYGAVAGGLAGAGAAAAGTAAYLNEKAKQNTGTDPASKLPESIQKSINEQNAASSSGVAPSTAAATSTASHDAARETTTSVPSEVTSSQKEAHASPEAAGNPEAVKEKSQAEKELLSKVSASQATGEPAPTATAATTATAPVASGAPQLADPVGGGLAPITMDEKPTGAAGASGLNAPAGSQAQTPATKANELAKGAAQGDSRDVSPMTKPSTTGQTQPVVTSGVESSTTPATSKPVGTPRNNNTAGASSTPTKRNSIMDRIKGTPDSQKTTDSSGSTKKKGLFSRIKEKLKQ